MERAWWVQRWLELLDSYRFKKRLERARIYSKEGHVLSIEFIEGEVIAKVQGSEVEPYTVSLSLKKFDDESWGYVIETLAGKALYSAQLLSGQMPDEIERVFTDSGLNLFPYNLTEVHSNCTCPDKANPCKHIGAIYYQLADRFDEDPFVLFELRGKSKQNILEALGDYRLGKLEKSPVDLSLETTVNPVKKVEEQELNLEQFWSYSGDFMDDLVVINPPVDRKTVFDLLGNFPLPPHESQAVRQFLDQVYQIVQEKALISAMNQ